MATAMTFPGVFIQEIPSGVHTITGVPTSVTAFIGRTHSGPIDTAVLVNSFGDFSRLFGGLDVGSSVSYAVRDFYQNGGGQAVIVRVYMTPVVAAGKGSSDGIARVTFADSGTNTLKFQAISPGAWANDLSITISVIDPLFTPAPAVALPAPQPNPTLLSVASLLGLDPTNKPDLQSIFSLSISSGGVTETIQNVTLLTTSTTLGTPTTRYIGQVLHPGNSESQLVVWTFGAGSDNVTPPTSIATILSANLSTAPGAPTNITVPQTVPVTTQGTDSAVITAGRYEGTVDSNNHAVTNGAKLGINALDNTDIFNILCIPPDTRSGVDPVSWGDTDPGVIGAAVTYAVGRRAIVLVDPPVTGNFSPVPAFVRPSDGAAVLTALANDIPGDNARNAAMYFPRVLEVDPLVGNKIGSFSSSGILAGIMATIDGTRGVWKAPAGIEAGLGGIAGLALTITDAENGEINPIGINALRTFPIIGSVVWGARTLRGADVLTDDYKYLPVRRFALFLEESLVRGLKFAVFEPNDEQLWSQIRLNVGAFLNNLFRQGAFQGTTPRSAYFVKCDNETTTQNDINLGVVNVLVGFAPLKPAEFVVIKIQQIAGQINT